MFKVPEWGNDVPDSKVNFEKTSHRKKQKQSTTQTAAETLAQTQVNGVSKKQSAKKSTEKRKLKKNRQKNRELYQKLSKPQNDELETNFNDHTPGKFVLNPNRLESTENTQKDKIKNKKPKKQNDKKQKSNFQNQSNQANEVKKPNKRKHDQSKKNTDTDSFDIQNLDKNEPEEIIISAKKKKLDDAFKKEVDEESLFREKPRNKVNSKKERIKQMLENSNRRPINLSGNPLRERMLAKLQSAQFRYLNEKLYTSSGAEAKQLFQADPNAFNTYHQGYQQQIKKWPVNPLDIIVKRIMKMPRTHLIADMGCGSAALAKRVPHKVRSFDLVASTPAVEACDMAHTPLLTASMDAVVYCLALMGTELAAYLAEGNRVLKTGGHLLIAEVESRFDKLEDFTHGVERLGFKLVKSDQSHKVFYFLEFKKTQEAPKKAKYLALTLKPCLYKRR